MRNPSPEASDLSRAARKRGAILEAATKLFLAAGYSGTSMDEIAALAAVSKQTVYHHFADKKRLFSEIVIQTVKMAGDAVFADVQNIQDSIDIETDLRELARRQLALVMHPRRLQLRRLVIAEAARFPELGRKFYEQAPGRSIAALAAAFERLAARGVLRLNDPLLAAQHFNWLILSIPLNESMLLGNDESPPTEVLNHYADSGVHVFLAAYRNESSGSNSPSLATE